MTTAKPNPQRGRPRSNGEVIKFTASGQIEPSEKERLDRLCNETGRSRSYVVRAAILLLLHDHETGKIDWALPPEAKGFKP